LKEGFNVIGQKA
jgi:hypothetical protein